MHRKQIRHNPDPQRRRQGPTGQLDLARRLRNRRQGTFYGVHEGSHHVRDSVLDGTAPFTPVQGGDSAYGFRVRGGVHEDYDEDGEGGVGCVGG